MSQNKDRAAVPSAVENQESAALALRKEDSVPARSAEQAEAERMGINRAESERAGAAKASAAASAGNPVVKKKIRGADTVSEKRRARAAKRTQQQALSEAEAQKNEEEAARPNVRQLEAALKREHYKKRYGKVLQSTFYTLIVVAACAVLVAMLWMPVLQIYGGSMNPTLTDGQIVVAVKSSNFEVGDLVAFYQGNKLLIKRCIGGPGDWIDIEEDGTVYVNGEMLEEPYLSEKAFGECDIDLPYQVPDEKWFLMGDNRDVSVDSRNSAIRGVSQEQIVGRVVFRIWPLPDFGIIRS